MSKICDKFRRFLFLFYCSKTKIDFLILAINKLFHKSCGIQREQLFLMSDGVKIFTGLKSGAGICQIYLDSVYNIYKKFEPTDDSVVIDVGAFVGTFSLKTAVKNKNVKIIAIEPSPKNFAFLEKNVQINGSTNVLPIQCALSNFDGEALLYVSSGDPSLDSLERKVSENTVVVPVYKLDTLIGKLGIDAGKVSLVKMDAEGSEMKILEGATQLLKSRNVMFIIVAEHAPDEEKILSSFLEKNNFKTCIFRSKNEVIVYAKKS